MQHLKPRASARLPLAALAVALALSSQAPGQDDPGQADPAQDDPGYLADLAELSMEDLFEIEIGSVYGASRHVQEVSEAPSSVTVLTRDDIRKFGYRTLGELLQSTRGLYVTHDRLLPRRRAGLRLVEGWDAGRMRSRSATRRSKVSA
jgi:outer membrane receptor for ferric coprogen and ferric-rhodotorulic acid